MISQRVVYEQKQRGLLQGAYYLYVTPFMLKVQLLTKWWDIKGVTGEVFETFVNNMPTELRHDLLERFVNSIPYLPSVAAGQKFVQELLRENGIFSDEELLQSRLGGRLFLALAEADPDSALRVLERTLGTWTPRQDPGIWGTDEDTLSQRLRE